MYWGPSVPASSCRQPDGQAWSPECTRVWWIVEGNFIYLINQKQRSWLSNPESWLLLLLGRTLGKLIFLSVCHLPPLASLPAPFRHSNGDELTKKKKCFLNHPEDYKKENKWLLFSKTMIPFMNMIHRRTTINYHYLEGGKKDQKTPLWTTQKTMRPT